MEISSLKIFIAVAENGSVSTAAEQLHCVQSNVTARIKKLEEELQVSLFVRKSRGMELSTQGHVLLDHAYQLIDMERQAVRAVNASLDDGGTLSLGSMETAMAVRLPTLLKEFHKRHPKTELSVRTGTTDEMIKKVLDHQLDCAIVGSKVESDKIVQYPFFKERLVLVSTPGNEKSSTLLVYRKGCAYRARAEEWLRREGRLPYTIMEFGTQEGIIGCVSAGLGVTLLPQEVAKGLSKDLIITDLPDEIADVDTYLICNKTTIQTKPMETLMALTAEYAALEAA
ncbi:LysR family transcriptional regulator [Terasakiella sp. A23]|uniref:LysR family transcriptional regulator n=1 Tax=Terasakiella sp. FCG-A23 TaxID=3080561 RepID=UPI002954289A|nr:LysR family transcriptional regulator [Terasakiella sp. A23]MDV7338116.1 LysR family transcriptional regulator [Terasakiella sp. A23]